MSVRNFICETCTKRRVCGIMSKLEKFSDDAKKDLGVDITMDSCKENEDEDGDTADDDATEA